MLRTRLLPWLSLLLAWAMLIPAGGAAAQTTGPSASVLTLEEAAALLRVPPADLQALAEEGGVPGRRIGAFWRFERRALVEWLRTGGTDATHDEGIRPWEALAPASLKDTSGRGVAMDGDVSPGQASGPAGEGSRRAAIGEAPEDPTAEAVFLRSNRLLLGPGDVAVDVGQFYARRDSLLLAAVGSGVGLVTSEQSALSTIVFGRVGVFRETELFAGTTFSSQRARQVSSGTPLANSTWSGLGPTTVGVRHTMMREGRKRPDMVLSVSGRAPAGELSSAVSGGLVLVKSLDPVVLFANANYVRPFARAGAVHRPVDTVDVTLGYGLGLNDTTAISMAVAGVFAGSTASDTGPLHLPSAFNVRFGVTTALGRGVYLEPSVSVGLSGPGQSFTFGLTVPYSLQ